MEVYLLDRVLANEKSSTFASNLKEVDGYSAFMKHYQRGLSIEHADGRDGGVFEALKEQAYQANFLFPRHFLVIFTWGNVSVFDRKQVLMDIARRHGVCGFGDGQGR